MGDVTSAAERQTRPAQTALELIELGASAGVLVACDGEAGGPLNRDLTVKLVFRHKESLDAAVEQKAPVRRSWLQRLGRSFQRALPCPLCANNPYHPYPCVVCEDLWRED